MPLLTCVFLRDLQLDRFAGLFHAAEKGRNRFARLKIDRPVLDLDDHVVIELAIQRMEYIVSGACAIRLWIAPVQMMVVDEGTVENDATVRSKRPCQNIRRIRGRSSIRGRADSSFRISLHREPTKIRNEREDLIRFRLPPRGNSRVDRVERIDSADRSWAAQIDRQRKVYPPRSELICNARDLREKVALQDTRIGIDVVYVAAVDSDRCQQPCVLRGARQIIANSAAVKIDRRPCVPALDAAVQIVPLVHPANLRGRILLLIQRRNVFATSNLT